MLVVLYHAGLPIPGGYVGVDVFFVISGFLITALIAKELGNGTFSLMNFWERRIRRIFPASLVTMLAILLLGLLIMIPQDLENLAKSLIAQAMMLSNVYFWRDVDYFAGSAETKPLLHTWSLAVEEQFYLFYPPLLVALKNSRRWQINVLVGLAGLSLVLSVIGVAYRPQAAFYLLPFRSWELLLGGLIALYPPSITSRGVREGMAILGLAMILLGGLLFDAHTPFPGLAALLPCLGAALFIAGNLFEKTVAGRLLSWRPIVFIGLISYSLYLWHWPVMAFMRYLYLPFNATNASFAVAVSLGLATLSWKFVEGPFRKSHQIAGRQRWLTNLKPRAVVLAGISSLAVMAGLGSVILWRKGLPERYSEAMRLLVDDATWNGSEWGATKAEIHRSTFKTVGEFKDRFDFVVWGDSHALMYYEVIDEISKTLGLQGYFIGVPGGPPIPNVWRGQNRDYVKDTQKVIGFIKESGIRKVLLIARWTLYTEGYSEAELHFEEKGQRLEDGLIRDAESPQISTREDARRAFTNNMGEMLDQFEQAGIRVWIVKQVPEQLGPIAMPWLFKNLQFPTVPLLGTSPERHRDRQAFSDQCFARWARSNIQLVETLDGCFNAQGRPTLTAEGRACYRDNDHLSRFGAKYLIMERFDEVFEAIAQDIRTESLSENIQIPRASESNREYSDKF